MKKLMFVLVIGLMVSMFGCDDGTGEKHTIIYKVTGDSASVDIKYLDKKGNYSLITASLPWSYEWTETIEDNQKIKADITVTNNDNQHILVILTDNSCLILWDESKIQDEVIHLFFNDNNWCKVLK